MHEYIFSSSHKKYFKTDYIYSIQIEYFWDKRFYYVVFVIHIVAALTCVKDITILEHSSLK